jgi:hypothetical protein
MRPAFTAVIALPYGMAAATEQPPVIIVSPCKCRGDHGKDRWAVTALDLEKLQVLRLGLSHISARRWPQLEPDG